MPSMSMPGECIKLSKSLSSLVAADAEIGHVAMTGGELVYCDFAGRCKMQSGMGCTQQEFVIGRAFHSTRIPPAAHACGDVASV